MSKILVITPIYKICGRKELVRDSEAVHYLVKYWKEDNDVFVINSYINGISKIKRYFNINQLKYYFRGYKYICDDIPVQLIERQNIFFNQQNGLLINSFKYKRIIEQALKEKQFIPEKIIVHIPSTSKFFIKSLHYNCEKIAILHYTDVKFLKKHRTKFIEFLNSNFSRIYCRSKSLYNIFSKEKLYNLEEEIIYSGVEISNNDNLKSEKDFEEKLKFLYVGKLIKRKKLDILVKALSNINTSYWSLNVIGKGKMEKKYKKLVNDLKLQDNVTFLGAKPHNEIFEFMKNSDIFCMPSIKETLGLVYLEAMSQGCITIGTRNEGIDGIIENNINGFLIRPEESELLQLIKKIINMDEKKRKELSKKAILTANEFEEKKMSKRYLDIIMEEK